MKRLALPLVLSLILASTVWAGGELHRGNCLERGRDGCSVLPWQTGHARPAAWKETPPPVLGGRISGWGG